MLGALKKPIGLPGDFVFVEQQPRQQLREQVMLVHPLVPVSTLVAAVLVLVAKVQGLLQLEDGLVGLDVRVVAAAEEVAGVPEQQPLA